MPLILGAYTHLNFKEKTTMKTGALAAYNSQTRANVVMGKGLHNPRHAGRQTRAVKGTFSPKKSKKVTVQHGVSLKQWVVITVFFIALYAGVSWSVSPAAPVTSKTVEIYRYYTVERTNGRITLVRTDLDVYSIACDGLEPNDEGHNCVLMSEDAIAEFRSASGY
jgi:hypothetical protein